jgi:hypothetical protein
VHTTFNDEFFTVLGGGLSVTHPGMTARVCSLAQVQSVTQPGLNGFLTAAVDLQLGRAPEHTAASHLELPGGAYSDAKLVANRNGRDFGWEIAHGAVSRRPPIPLDTMVPLIWGYAYDVGVWDSSIVQGPFSVPPCQTRFATFASLSLPSLFCHPHVNASTPTAPHRL